MYKVCPLLVMSRIYLVQGGGGIGFPHVKGCIASQLGVAHSCNSSPWKPEKEGSEVKHLNYMRPCLNKRGEVSYRHRPTQVVIKQEKQVLTQKSTLRLLTEGRALRFSDEPRGILLSDKFEQGVHVENIRK